MAAISLISSAFTFLSSNALLVVSSVFAGFLLVVVLNVAKQLVSILSRYRFLGRAHSVLHSGLQVLPKDPTLPPVVFHVFPIIGSTISYGMDPHRFFETCKQKVGIFLNLFLVGVVLLTPVYCV
jgi:hypothetical protein